MADINDLIQNVERLFDGRTVRKVDPEKSAEFGRRVASVVANRIQNSGLRQRAYLRLSNIGKPARQVYYDIQGYGRDSSFSPEELSPSDRLKFLYGDIIEELFLYLASEAGHVVSDRQKRVEVDGIEGHIDCKIDGVLVDVKSASKYAFSKFADGSILEGNDPFGYVSQLSGYAKAEGATEGFIWAIEKERANQTLVKVPVVDPSPKIKELREALDKSEPPARCYESVPSGKSGNKELAIGCVYCPHKQHCWQDANKGRGLRRFEYAQGPKFLTEVFKTPDVPETTNTHQKV